MEKETLEYYSKSVKAINKMISSSTAILSLIKDIQVIVNDDMFDKMLDKNSLLLGVQNGVIDFSVNSNGVNGIFRDGRLDDYVMRFCPVNFNIEPNQKDLEELMEFLRSIFVKEEMFLYMIKVLASTLYGKNVNQSFYYFKGSGANGKTSLFDLMSKLLGNYFVKLFILT